MKLTLNSSIKGLSGTMDGWVYRQVGDEVIVAALPKCPNTSSTAAQEAGRQRFAHAVRYAQITLEDACQKEVYQELGRQRKRRADKLLTSDFLTPPEIRRIDLSKYRGRPGDIIRVVAFDDIAVASVTVSIASMAGTVLERGAAREVHGVWCYATTLSLPENEPVTVTATARDRPGNETSASVVANRG